MPRTGARPQGGQDPFSPGQSPRAVLMEGASHEPGRHVLEGEPVVLIGDSGQHDPEIYRQIVEEHPGRVLAVYIRNVSRDPKRIKEIEELAEAVAATGSSLVLAADSSAIAEHAARLGLMDPAAVASVESEQASEGGTNTQGRTLHAGTPQSDGNADQVTQGELRDVLRSDPDGEPPNIVVEPDKPQG